MLGQRGNRAICPAAADVHSSSSRSVQERASPSVECCRQLRWRWPARTGGGEMHGVAGMSASLLAQKEAARKAVRVSLQALSADTLQSASASLSCSPVRLLEGEG